MPPADSGSAALPSAVRPRSLCVPFASTAVDLQGEWPRLADFAHSHETFAEKLAHAADRLRPHTLDGLKKRRGDDGIPEITPEPLFELVIPPDATLGDQSLIASSRGKRPPGRHQLLGRSVQTSQVRNHRLSEEEDFLAPGHERPQLERRTVQQLDGVVIEGAWPG